MNLRTVMVFTLVLLFSLVQTLGRAGLIESGSVAHAQVITSAGDAGVALKADKDKEKEKKEKKEKEKNDNKDEDEDEDEDDDDCSGIETDGDASSVTTASPDLANVSVATGAVTLLKADKDKDKEKEKKEKEKEKEKNDNKDDEDDDDDDCSGNTYDGEASVTTAATTPTGTLPTTEVTGTSTGGDSTVSLVDERVVLRIFSWMPKGVTFKMRFVDPSSVTALPGKRAGNMVFRIEAQDAAGQSLDMLPAEVNLSARYADRDIAGSDEKNVMLSRFDPTDSKWKASPKITRVAENNYVAASITEPGIYAIHIP